MSNKRKSNTKDESSDSSLSDLEEVFLYIIYCTFSLL